MVEALDIDLLKRWIGQKQVAVDLITPRLAASLLAILDEPTNAGLAHGDPAPAGIHWCLCPEIAPMSGLGRDGHPARGNFLPPVPLPRRMWAGGSLRYRGVFRVGDMISRASCIEDVEVKHGRTGTLCFVTVKHDYSGPDGPILTEYHNIVYRDIAATTAPRAAPLSTPVATVSQQVASGPVLLSRYSSVTFNGHRIHYDRDYCRDVEFYPGLLVHGPLQVTFLLRLAGQMLGQPLPTSLDFRGMAPLFDTQPFSTNGAANATGLDLWIADADGTRTMVATAL